MDRQQWVEEQVDKGLRAIPPLYDDDKPAMRQLLYDAMEFADAEHLKRVEERLGYALETHYKAQDTVEHAGIYPCKGHAEAEAGAQPVGGKVIYKSLRSVAGIDEDVAIAYECRMKGLKEDDQVLVVVTQPSPTDPPLGEPHD